MGEMARFARVPGDFTGPPGQPLPPLTWQRRGAIFIPMTATVARICRYPVKGLTPESLDAAELTEGRGLPDDRRFALTLGTTSVSGPTTEWMPKTSFLILMRHEKLAVLKTKFDSESGVLIIERGGKQVTKGNITPPVGRAMIEEFFAAYMGEAARGRPKLVEAEAGAVLSDHPSAVVSIINLASIKDLERVTGKPIDPLRFRGNIYLDGLEPWAEFDWVGSDITMGKATLAVQQRIDRCAATNVDPETGARDLNLPKDLQRGFGHADMGVYAAVTAPGRVALGNPIILSE